MSERRIRLNILGKVFDVDVELISTVSNIVSTIVGVSALLFGIFQFQKGLERTDLQIQFLRDEQLERASENQPILRTENFRVNADEFNWDFHYEVVNVGKRRADSVISINCVLSYNGNENLSDSYIVPMYSSETLRTGPVLIQDTIRSVKSFKRIDTDIYLIRIQTDYKDHISNQHYVAADYYKVDLNQTPAKITGYYDDQKHSSVQKHQEFHNIFRLYFPNIDR